MPIHMKGFSLIELMLVVAIVGILSTVLLIGEADYQRRSHDKAANADVKNALLALMASVD